MIDEEYEHEPLDISEFLDENKTEEIETSIKKIDNDTNNDIVEYKEVSAPESVGVNQDLEHDYRRVRDTYYDIIEKGQDALENLLEIAASSEHPRAYEVSAQLMKTISDTNDKIVDLHKQLRDIKEKDVEIANQENGGTTVNNNAVFVGSMKDFQQFIKNMKNKTIEATEIMED